MLTFRAQGVAANYATKNGAIIIEASKGVEPYEYSIDAGFTFSSNSTFQVYGGIYSVTVRDSLGNQAEIQDIAVSKSCSREQAEYLNALFGAFGNRSQAANDTILGWDNSVNPPKPKRLSPRTVYNWEKDIDFAKLVDIEKSDAANFEQDFIASKMISLINGGIPIYQWVQDPQHPTDITKRVKIQVGETAPSGDMLKFLAKTKHRGVYSERTEITGANGNQIMCISMAQEYSLGGGE